MGPTTTLRLPGAAGAGYLHRSVGRAWADANYICGERLPPSLPELAPTLERHGHLAFTDEVPEQL